MKGASIIALDNSQPQNNPFVAWQTSSEKHSLKKEKEIEFPPVLGVQFTSHVFLSCNFRFLAASAKSES
jgi:hypothetical protein